MIFFKDSVTSLDVSDHEILVGSADKHIRNYDLRMGALGKITLYTSGNFLVKLPLVTSYYLVAPPLPGEVTPSDVLLPGEVTPGDVLLPGGPSTTW